MNKLPESTDYARGAAVPWPKTEYVPRIRRVRAFLGDQAIADSRRAILKRGRPWNYYFPPEDVRMEFLEVAKEGDQGPRLWTLRVGDSVAERAAFAFETGSPDAPDLEGYIGFKWDAMDAWFEEDEQVYVHPRDPYVRIDVLHSSRQVRVEVAGETVAETTRPVMLFETALPVRFYFPRPDVHMDWMVPSESQTGCPYKGWASYYTLEVGEKRIEDAAWYYPFPHPQMSKIQNLIAFYPRKVDGFYVDGEPWEGEK